MIAFFLLGGALLFAGGLLVRALVQASKEM